MELLNFSLFIIVFLSFNVEIKVDYRNTAEEGFLAVAFGHIKVWVVHKVQNAIRKQTNLFPA